MECPKCGRAVATGAFICPGCDYILDASFLGDDITDDERDHRPIKKAAPKAAPRTRAPQPDFGEDAMILGDIGDLDGAPDEVSSFKSRDAGVSQREATQAKFYFGGVVAQLMQPDAIPEPAGGGNGASIRMTPFERHVLSFVNGKRSVGRIQKKSAMDESEFKTALAMLADKGFIKLKGFKKPREGSTSRSQAPRRPIVAAPPAAERTVVASMEHIEALAKAGLRAMSEAPTRVGPLPSVRTSPPAAPGPVSAVSAVAAPAPPAPPATSSTVIATAPAVSRRFASLQAEPAVEPSPSSRLDDDEPIDPLRAAAAAAWDDVDNQSSVFSDGPSSPALRSLPSLVDNDPADAPPPRRQHPLAATRPTGHFSAPVDDRDDDRDDEDARRTAGRDDGLDDGLAALRDPTGMGDAVDDDQVGAGGGAPIDDGGFDDNGFDDEEDEVVAFSDPSLEAVDDADVASWHEDLPPLSEPAGTVADDDIDDGLLGPPRRIHDDKTAALPVMAPVQHTVPLQEPQPPHDDSHNDFGDFDISPKTNVLPRPLTLAPSALMPIDPPPPPPPAPAPAAPAIEVPRAPTVLSLPGQNLRAATAPPASFSVGPTPATAGPSTLPPAARPLAATRVSAASQVPFELRKKAERIYEQALKDRAEGRLSSALMNAKLAMNFDSTVEAYKELFEALNVQKAQPQGPRPRELVLFEQASEAEGKGDHLRAVKLLEEAIAVNPRAAALHNRIGVVLSIRLKRHEEALVYLKNAIELEPGSVVYMNNFSKVTGLLESVLEKGPKKRKGNLDDDGGKVAVKKIRPKMF